MYITDNINLAATLMVLGFKFMGINKIPNKRSEFKFKREDGLDQMIEMYWQRMIQIEPQDLYRCSKFLRRELLEGNL